jgi:uncharacterized protein DUF5677
MRKFKENDVAVWIDAATMVARRLKEAIVGEEIYVATGVATSSIPFSHLTKAFQVHEAVLILCRGGYGSEAIALSRVMLEMFITLRWITNQDQNKRAEEFAFFVAKRKEYAAKTFAKYQPENPVSADAVRFVENAYRQYADKYASWVFWSNKPNNLRQLAEEKEMLIEGLAAPDDDALMLYELFYSHASDHVHVTALALDEVFPSTGAPYEPVAEKDPRNVFNAVVFATQWLFRIVIQVNAFRQLGLETKIDDAHAEFAKLF